MAQQNSTSRNTGSFLVVNMRGLVNTRTPVRTTLEQLSISRRFNATIVPDTDSYRGMLRLTKDHVSWCRLDIVLAEKLLSARSEKSTGTKYPETDLGKSKKYQSFAELAKALASGEANLSHLKLMRPFFRLTPPRGGFRRSSRRQHAEGGVLGANEDLPKLVEKML